LEGHEFTCAAQLLKMVRALAPEYAVCVFGDFFRSLLAPTPLTSGYLPYFGALDWGLKKAIA